MTSEAAGEGDSRLSDLFTELSALDAAAREARLVALGREDADLATHLRWMFTGDRHVGGVTEAIGTLVVEALDGPSGVFTPGAHVGPYRLLEAIGAGGMGRVFRAVREDNGQEVAVKVLRLPWITRDDRLLFLREQRLLSRLHHRGIAQLHDADVLDDGTPWFSMEFVRGGLPITTYCDEGDLDVTARVRLFREACDAVRHAHEQGIIHRDLKPGNILVARDGHVKLLDFGIAKAFDEVAEALGGTQTVGPRLTPAYAAPEQLRGGRADVRTDVHGLGRVFYELLTGERPFADREQDPAGLWQAVQHDQAVPPSQRRPVLFGRMARGARRDLDVLCQQAMHVDPARRYATVDALIADLDAFLLGHPLAAHPDSIVYRGRKFLRRHAVASGLAAALVISVMAVSVTAVVRVRRAQQATLAEAARTELVQRFLLDLLGGEDADVGPAQDLRVRTLLARGVAGAGSLSGNPDLQGELFGTIGSLYQQLGDLPEAESLLTQAQALKAKRFAADSHEVLGAQIDLALLRLAQSRYEDAETIATDVLTRARGRYPSTDDAVLRAQLTLGRTLTGRSDYDRAIPLLQTAVDGFRLAGPPSEELALALGELASAHQYAGHLDVAQQLNDETLALDRRLHGDRHPVVAHDLLNQSDLANSRGRYDDAARLAREAVAIFESWYGPEHPETGSALVSLAAPLKLLDQLDEADASLQRAQLAFERAYAGPHRRLGLVLNERGNVASMRGRYDEALEAYQRALAIYKQVFPDGKSLYVAVGLANVASVYLAMTDYARAEPVFRDAIALSTELLTTNHMNTAISQVKLARVLVQTARPEEAMTLLETAYATLMRQTAPSTRWVQMAREAYTQAHVALKRPGTAEAALARLAAQ